MKKAEKLSLDFRRLMETQNFKSEEDLRKFMDSMVGQTIPSFPEETLSPKEKAQDLVYSAYEMNATKAKQNIKHALELDPDCIEAYEYLAGSEKKFKKIYSFYLQGIEIGQRLFGGKFLEESKGHFWLIHETRPYLRCMSGLADCLVAMGMIREAAFIVEEILILNKGDNMGVRYPLQSYYIYLNDHQAMTALDAIFEGDKRSYYLFNRALHAYATVGDTEEARRMVVAAQERNKFVARRLVYRLPSLPIEDYVRMGSDEEADYYVSFARLAWDSKEGAIDWLAANMLPL